MQDKLNNIKDQLNFLSQQFLDKETNKNLTPEQINYIKKQISLLESINLHKDFKNINEKKINVIKEKPSQIEVSNLINIFNKGEFKSAEAKALELIKNYSDNSIVYEVLALSLLNQEQLIDALTFIKKAIEIDPKKDGHHINLGFILCELGRIEDAKKAYIEAIKINSKNHITYYNLGYLFQKEKYFEDAKANYLQSININPNYFKTHLNLANTIMELGMTKEVHSENQIYSNLSSSDAGTDRFLQSMKCVTINAEKAIESYIKALQLNNINESWANIYYPLFIMKYIKKNKDFLEDYFNNKEFNEIRFSILKYKLSFGEESSNYYFNNAIQAIEANTENYIKNPKYNIQNERKQINIPKKIIALLHLGRSGSGFLHSLIDNHSEVSTLPSYYLNHFFDSFIWQDLIKDGFDGIVDRFINAYEVFFDARASKPTPTCLSFPPVYDQGKKEGMTNLGKNKEDFLFIDKNLFKRELADLIIQYKKIDSLILFKLIHVAYERVLNKNKNKNTIFYHIHNPDSYSKLNFARLANDAKWLLTVRDPVESCESWIYENLVKNDYKNIYIKINTMLFTVDHPLFKERNSIAMRLEDLKEKPKETIAALCNWMEIKEEDSLYQMTAQGKIWWGDMSSPERGTFGKVNKRKQGSVFSEKDKFILETLFHPFRVRFNYTNENVKKFKKDLLIIRPMIDEIFDFEKKIASKNNIEEKKFIISGYPYFLRTSLLSRWETLNKYGTYPNMIKPLVIK